MELRNWFIKFGGFNPLKAPELQVPSLSGEVYGHPRFEDGKVVTISRVVSYEDGVITTVSGSKYIFGDPHPGYEEAFPNAKERMIAQIKKLLSKVN